MCVLSAVYIILTGYLECDFYFQNPSIKLCLSCVSDFSLYIFYLVSGYVDYHFSIHSSSSLHPPPLHSVHPVLHSMPVFGWCSFSTRALVFSAGSQSLSRERRSCPLSGSRVWVVKPLPLMSWVMNCWLWFSSGLAVSCDVGIDVGLQVSGVSALKRGAVCECVCVFVRVRVNKRGVFCMPVEPCRGSCPTLNRGIVISFCSYLPSHYPLQLLCWCISGVSGLILMSLLFSLSLWISAAWVGGTSARRRKNLLHRP